MTEARESGEIQPGLAVIHGNRLEDLRELWIAWIAAHPLAPLENEVVLVQSNGMAQWLKLGLADDAGLGIAAAVAMQLPARFLWETYRRVLGPAKVPERAPFERAALCWRFYRLLPTLMDQPGFEPLAGFLGGDEDARKRHQLAAALAGLFDQYQVYRADWLADWAEGREQLRDGAGQTSELPAAQVWQARLWRALLKDLPESEQGLGRAALHRRFVSALEGAPWPDGLPRRLSVFGISSLPGQTVAALTALSSCCQVLFFVQNPCRYYWADIIEHRELLCSESRRQARKATLPGVLAEEDLHLHAHPLLAAWGKQGRDYLALLDAEEGSHGGNRIGFDRIDLFEDYGQEGSRSLLQQVQQAILDLQPLPSAPQDRRPVTADSSLVFHVAHSPQREVEILRDQLLGRFASEPALQPRDVIVMVPDIDTYAPHIRAVFGQVAADDPRHLPFSIADQRERGRDPVLRALDGLLRLPDSRWSVAELLDLLEVGPVRRRFGLRESDLPLLHRWIEGAGIRWGLDGRQRADLDLPHDLEQNAWRFGLRRMLLGYAVGEGEAHAEIEPYGEIGGLDAALVGPLVGLIDTLERYATELARPAGPAVWGERLRGLLATLFQAEDERTELMLGRLLTALESFEEDCQDAGLDEDLPLAVVREAWLERVDEPGLTQPFLAGRVCFCTLLPMRAVPFAVVCLLGMNDADFPRPAQPLGFDLMARPGFYRPGDRSRRQDDRYLFLEALLSARRALHVSWVGRRVADNLERPPSLLVAQLRDYLAAGWVLADAEGIDGGQALLRALTVEHPLQPFSPRYFLPDGAVGQDPRLFSYAREWRAAHDAGATVSTASKLQPLPAPAPLGLEMLSRFLRRPVQAFYNQRLQVWLEAEATVTEDLEPFVLDALQEYRLADELLAAALRGSEDEAPARFEAIQARQRRRGELPLAVFAAPAQERYAGRARSAHARAAVLRRDWGRPIDRPVEISLRLDLNGAELLLEDWLGGLYQRGENELALIEVRPGPVAKEARSGLRPKYHNLLALWVRHLAGCAAGLPLQSFQLGSDCGWRLPELTAEQARALLAVIATAWSSGMSEPLPLACKTALVWLGERGDPARARAEAEKAYENDYQGGGERGEDPYLNRTFPSFAALWQREKEFVCWAESLYLPLLNQVQKYPEPKP